MKFQLICMFLILAFDQSNAQFKNDTISKSSVNTKMLTAAIVSESSIYVGGISYLQFIWYRDHNRVPFHFYNDNSGYLQIDKLGHSFAAYTESYIAYKWLRKAGVEKTNALLYGGSLGFILQAPIEVFDGLYEGWGFSWGDMAANTTGSLLLIAQELIFNEQSVRYKISFSPSEMSKNSYGYLGDNMSEIFFYDYNGHSYWLSMNMNKIFLKDKLPSWLNIAVGYSANGMLGEFKNRTYYAGHRLPEYERTRQYLISLDIDWEKIPTRSKLLKALFSGLNFIKLPFPAVEINSKGQFNGYWCYF